LETTKAMLESSAGRGGHPVSLWFSSPQVGRDSRRGETAGKHLRHSRCKLSSEELLQVRAVKVPDAQLQTYFSREGNGDGTVWGGGGNI